ncbi:MAG: hypothetical protein SGI74_07805 [Oligoflexia bacterium]|nr:hypothetical protein [Oligoflexia bacterium]
MIKKLIALVCLLVSTAVFAANEKVSDKVISLHVKKLGVRQAVEAVLNLDSNIKYEISDKVTNDKKISLKIKKMKITDALAAIADIGGVKYTITPTGSVAVDL